VLDTLIATHRIERGPIHTPSGQHPLALYEQHIAQVASVFEGRPRLRLAPGP
jgi:hypothetical protein